VVSLFSVVGKTDRRERRVHRDFLRFLGGLSGLSGSNSGNISHQHQTGRLSSFEATEKWFAVVVLAT
ncbi:MAG: hypothetical protein ACUVR6_10895, partial [Anaerolineae bacterium]